MPATSSLRPTHQRRRRILGSGQYLIGGATAARQVGGGFQTSPLQIETGESTRAGLSITWNINIMTPSAHTLRSAGAVAKTLAMWIFPRKVIPTVIFGHSALMALIWPLRLRGFAFGQAMKLQTGNFMPGNISFHTSSATGDEAPERIRVQNSDGRITLISSPGIQFGAENTNSIASWRQHRLNHQPNAE